MIVFSYSLQHSPRQMNKAGTELMLINKQNYKALVDVLIQVHMRGKLSRDEVEVLKHFVDL